MFLASLSLVYTQPVMEKQRVVDDIEKEFDHWLERFPVPLMVSAWDFKGDGIEFPDIHTERFLSGYSDLAGSVVRTWGTFKDSDFPGETKSTEHRLSAYSELEAITAAEIQQKADAHRRMIKVGWWMVFIWAVAIPSMLAILGFFNLFYVGAIALAYSLYRAVRKTLEMTGLKKRSRRLEEKEREDTDMRHHHYHCKKNPEGFMRLKIENFERDEIERIRKESQEIR